MYLDLKTLAKKVGRTVQTLRLHRRNGWLKAEDMPGAKGWRVKESEAKRWAKQYFSIELNIEPKV